MDEGYKRREGIILGRLKIIWATSREILLKKEVDLKAKKIYSQHITSKSLNIW